MMDKIKIGGIVYEVKVINRLCASDGLLDGHLKHGETTIELDSELNDQAAAQVLLHEIFHAIFAHLGRQHSDENEMLVDSLAFSMLQVLRDNPELTKTIRALDEK